uniref:Endonuclease V n=1 Tax=Kalanchoe fedtschenkoi TaxID=63787 RepID=A0A7N0UBK6_KALFE
MEKKTSDDVYNPATAPEHWIRAQDSLKTRLVLGDDFAWLLHDDDKPELDATVLRYVGGVDVSYAKEHPTAACGALVVLDLTTLEVVYEDFSFVHLNVPYVPGFLAFREAPVVLELLEKMKISGHPCYPQLLMVDGNGVLHPRGFGLASHLGVLADLPSIGIGKNLHCIEGLSEAGVRQLFTAKAELGEEYIALHGQSGCILGAAMVSAQGSTKPIYISTGHRISLASAIRIVKLTCKFRVPEAIRQADIRSRAFLQRHLKLCLDH